jgi:hypothetical protein
VIPPRILPPARLGRGVPPSPVRPWPRPRRGPMAMGSPPRSAAPGALAGVTRGGCAAAEARVGPRSTILDDPRRPSHVRRTSFRPYRHRHGASHSAPALFEGPWPSNVAAAPAGRHRGRPGPGTRPRGAETEKVPGVSQGDGPSTPRGSGPRAPGWGCAGRLPSGMDLFPQAEVGRLALPLACATGRDARSQGGPGPRPVRSEPSGGLTAIALGAQDALEPSRVRTKEDTGQCAD